MVDPTHPILPLLTAFATCAVAMGEGLLNATLGIQSSLIPSLPTAFTHLHQYTDTRTRMHTSTHTSPINI